MNKNLLVVKCLSLIKKHIKLFKCFYDLNFMYHFLDLTLKVYQFYNIKYIYCTKYYIIEQINYSK